MAIGLQNYPNISPADSDYLYGRIKDNPGDGSGTPINQDTNGDLHEFFAKLMGLAGITPNGLPDNEYSGHQYILALNKFINTNVGADIIKGLIGSYTTNDLIVLWGCSITGSFGLGTANITAGAIFYNDIIYKVPAATVVTGSLETAIFKINTSVQPNIIYLTNGSSLSGIADYNDSTVKYLANILKGTFSNLTLSNGFIDGGPPSPQYRKDSYGIVTLNGLITAPSSISLPTFGNLPIGYRPSHVLFFPAYCTNTQTFYILEVDGIGNLTISQPGGTPIPGNSSFYISGIRFTVDS